MRDQRVSRIAIEGIDGCGKDVQLELLHKALNRRQYNVMRRREPSETSPLGKFIRKQFSAPTGYGALDDAALSVLFAADRIMQWWDDTHELQSALVREGGRKFGGPVVLLSNRCVASAYAYHGLDNPMHEFLSPPEVWPDLVVVLRVPLEVASHRLQSRTDLDRYEQQGRLARVAPEYEKLSEVCPPRTTVIYVDGTPDEYTVASEVLGEVEEWLTEQTS